MRGCVVIFLVDRFWVFFCYIFGRAILLLFRMIVEGVLDHVYCICLYCIAVIGILVWWLGWW